LLAVGLHACTAVARSLCVSWAFLFIVVSGYLLGSLTLWSNSWVGGMRRNIGPAAAGPAATALCEWEI